WPILRRERSKRLDAKRFGIRTVESIGERRLKIGNFGNLAMRGEGRILANEGGKVAPEPAGAALIGGVGGDISRHQPAEGLVAEISVQLLIVPTDSVGQSCHIGVAINAEQDVALFLGAVIDLGEDGIVAGKDTALKCILDLAKALHSAACSR